MSQHKLLRFWVRFFDGIGAYRTSWKICGRLLKKEASPQCGLVNVDSYISGVGFYACHLSRGHEGDCAIKPVTHDYKSPEGSTK